MSKLKTRPRDLTLSPARVRPFQVLTPSFFVGLGLVNLTSMSTAISARGIREVEEIESDPNHSTSYFPSINIMNVGQVSHSQLQQGNYQSNQTGTFTTNELQALLRFLDRLNQSLADLTLPPDDKDQAEAEITTIRAQASSKRPNSVIIKESLGSLRRVLESAAGGYLGKDLLPELLRFLAS